MESLGFTDTRSMWSDRPIRVAVTPQPPPAPPAPAPPDDPSITDWEPSDIGTRLSGGNMRWSVLVAAVILMIGAGVAAYWLYQRPEAEAIAAEASLDVEVAALSDSLPRLEELSAAMASRSDDLAGIDITAVSEAARGLFDAGAALTDGAAEDRFLATGAASSALDGVRLAEETRAYSLAVTPILETPALETDPALIGLDDAVRSFGDWQLWFDDVRTALPDSVLPRVTERLDVLSGDLALALNRYVDALREDDRAAANAVVTDLGLRLGEVRSALDSAIGDIAVRIDNRIEETRDALGRLDAA